MHQALVSCNDSKVAHYSKILLVSLSAAFGGLVEFYPRPVDSFISRWNAMSIHVTTVCTLNNYRPMPESDACSGRTLPFFIFAAPRLSSHVMGVPLLIDIRHLRSEVVIAMDCFSLPEGRGLLVLVGSVGKVHGLSVSSRCRRENGKHTRKFGMI